MAPDLERVREVARRVRNSLELLPRNLLTMGYARFPSGACGDASRLLGAFLADFGITGFEYVYAERGSHDAGGVTTHGWLRRDNLIVDITADQFDDFDEAVFVGDASEWHGTFRVVSVDAADFREDPGHACMELYDPYTRIKRVWLDASKT